MKSNPLSTRRSILQLALGFSASLAVPRFILGADEADAFGGLVPGMQSYSFRAMSLADALAAMQKLGIREVEIFPGHLKGLSDAQARKMLCDNGITAVSYGVIKFTSDIEENRKLFELAKTYGMKNLSCDPDPDAFDSLDKLTEEYSITTAIHPHGPKHRWGKIDAIQNAIKDHSLKIGLCADTGHLIRAGEDPLRALEVFADRLYALHIKDFKKLGPEKWEDVPASDGSLDIDAVIKFLLDHKFTGAMLVEYEGENEIESVRKSLDRVKQAVQKARSA